MSNTDRATSGPHTANSSITDGEIVVQSLSATQWRVRDKRWPENDARSLVGFIERKGELFEVTQLDRGSEWFWFGSLTEATAHFIDVQPEDVTLCGSVSLGSLLISQIPSLAG